MDRINRIDRIFTSGFLINSVKHLQITVTVQPSKFLDRINKIDRIFSRDFVP